MLVHSNSNSILFISFFILYNTQLNWPQSAHVSTWTVRIKFNQFFFGGGEVYLLDHIYGQKYTCVMCIKWAKISYTTLERRRKRERESTTKKTLTAKNDRFEKWNNIKRLNLLLYISFYHLQLRVVCVWVYEFMWVCTHALIISKVNA